MHLSLDVGGNGGSGEGSAAAGGGCEGGGVVSVLDASLKRQFDELLIPGLE